MFRYDILRITWIDLYWGFIIYPCSRKAWFKRLSLFVILAAAGFTAHLLAWQSLISWAYPCEPRSYDNATGQCFHFGVIWISHKVCLNLKLHCLHLIIFLCTLYNVAPVCNEYSSSVTWSVVGVMTMSNRKELHYQCHQRKLKAPDKDFPKACITELPLIYFQCVFGWYIYSWWRYRWLEPMPQ